MSDRRLRTAALPGSAPPLLPAPATSTTCTSPISKQPQPRKPRLRNADHDMQRERKRALDRKAQRASREKTRSHIAHLEKMVQILSEKNGSAATSDLMEEMTRLHAEIDRLRKIIDSIKSVLGADISEATAPAPQRQISQSSDEGQYSHPDSPASNTSKSCEVNLPSDENPTPQTPNETSMNNNWDEGTNDAPGDLNADEFLQAQNTNMLEAPYKSINGFSWGNSLDNSSGAQTTHCDGPSQNKDKVFEHTQFWNLPCPVKTAMPEPPAPNFAPCQMWQKANAVFARIFDCPQDKILSVNRVDAGSLFKMVKEGWGSLSLKEQANPVLQILKEVDQGSFSHLDPVSKVANLYKNLILLKYYSNGDPRYLEQMPPWQRPVASQKTRGNTLAINFSPWPALRDRLARHHHYYLATSDFLDRYRQHFKFTWPFGFDNTYSYDAPTKTYHISPMFERYHSDVRCWSMEPVFFQKFPEMIGELSVFQEGGMNGIGIEGGDLSAQQRFLLANGTFGEGGHGANFANPCEMELFNDYPPTKRDEGYLFT